MQHITGQASHRILSPAAAVVVSVTIGKPCKSLSTLERLIGNDRPIIRIRMILRAQPLPVKRTRREKLSHLGSNCPLCCSFGPEQFGGTRRLHVCAQTVVSLSP